MATTDEVKAEKAEKIATANRRLDMTFRELFAFIHTGSWVDAVEVDENGVEVSVAERIFSDFEWVNRNWNKTLRPAADDQLRNQKRLGKLVDVEPLRKERENKSTGTVDLAEALS